MASHAEADDCNEFKPVSILRRRTVRGQRQVLVQWEEGWCSLGESDPLWNTVAAVIRRGRDGRTQVRWDPSWEIEGDFHWVPDAAAHDLWDASDAGAGGGHGDAGGANVQQGCGVEARASGGGLLDRSTRGSRKIKTSLVAFLSSSRSRRTVPPGRPSPAIAAAALSKESEARPTVPPGSPPPPNASSTDTSRCSSRSSDEVSASLEPSGPLPPAAPYLKRSRKRRRHRDPSDTASGIVISSSSGRSSSSSHGKTSKDAPSESLVPLSPHPSMHPTF
jgi:hypothetical protein